jgi:hypothetical protein
MVEGVESSLPGHGERERLLGLRLRDLDARAVVAGVPVGVFSHAHKPEPDTGCDNPSVSAPQNRDGSGRWPKGVSGNPGGRPKGLAKATRELVGEDGMALAQLWWDIARDETRRDSHRLEASRLLADRGWGKAGNFEPVEGDPLDLSDAEAAAEEFTAKILQLADREPGTLPRS